jgi:hypothetical protein
VLWGMGWATIGLRVCLDLSLACLTARVKGSPAVQGVAGRSNGPPVGVGPADGLGTLLVHGQEPRSRYLAGEPVPSGLAAFSFSTTPSSRFAA